MQRLFSRFADLPMAAKLALLSGVAVLASLLIAYGGRTGLADLKSASDTEVELSRARASLHHLDTRNSELKVDAYRALPDDPEAVGIGRAHVGTPDTNAQLVCRLLLEQQ